MSNRELYTDERGTFFEDSEGKLFFTDERGAPLVATETGNDTVIDDSADECIFRERNNTPSLDTEHNLEKLNNDKFSKIRKILDTNGVKDQLKRGDMNFPGAELFEDWNIIPSTNSGKCKNNLLVIIDDPNTVNALIQQAFQYSQTQCITIKYILFFLFIPHDISHNIISFTQFFTTRYRLRRNCFIYTRFIQLKIFYESSFNRQLVLKPYDLNTNLNISTEDGTNSRRVVSHHYDIAPNDKIRLGVKTQADVITKLNQMRHVNYTYILPAASKVVSSIWNNQPYDNFIILSIVTIEYQNNGNIVYKLFRTQLLFYHVNNITKIVIGYADTPDFINYPFLRLQRPRTFPRNDYWKFEEFAVLTLGEKGFSIDPGVPIVLDNNNLTYVNDLLDEINRVLPVVLPVSTQKEKKSNNIMPPLNTILYGPPGTGKTYNTINKSLEIINRNSNRNKKVFDAYIANGQIVFTTFHQSMSYEDFIEGIKPITTNGKLIYKVEDGIFKHLCKVAELNIDKNFVLIIDEINRGNVSQIFGELITLIEEDKRLGKAEELQVMLPYSKLKFGVPANLYIIGTMNTADRSVEALDSALRRRFSFEEMPPLPLSSLILNNKFGGLLSKLLDTINKRIEILLDKDHQIGHSYFMSVSNLQDLKAVFQNKIIPLLQEYFFGDYGKIGLILGKGFVEIVNPPTKNIFPNFNYDASGFAERPIYKIKNILLMSDYALIKAIKLMLK